MNQLTTEKRVRVVAALVEERKIVEILLKEETKGDT